MRFSNKDDLAFGNKNLKIYDRNYSKIQELQDHNDYILSITFSLNN